MTKNMLLSLIFILGFPPCASAVGSSVRGGGDACENRIKNIRDDISDWIDNDGPAALDLPESLSLEMYTQGMLEQITQAKIQCVGSGDSGYPVQINGTPKVCRFHRNSHKSIIVCDYKKFQSLDESEQYTLIHHEYAGLAGLENPNGSDSTYKISNQISYYLEDEIVKKLAVKERPAPKVRLLPDIIPLNLPYKDGEVKIELHDISKVSISPYPYKVYRALQDFQLHAAQGLGKTRLYLVTNPSPKGTFLNISNQELPKALRKYHQSKKGCFIEEPGAEKMFVWLFLNSAPKEWFQVANSIARFFDTYANYAYAHQLAASSYRCLKEGGRNEDNEPWYSVRDAVIIHSLKEEALPQELRDQYSEAVLVFE